MELFNKIANQDAHAYYLSSNGILYLVDFEFDSNAVETQGILIDSSVCPPHFSAEHDVLQQVIIKNIRNGLSDPSFRTSYST